MVTLSKSSLLVEAGGRASEGTVGPVLAEVKTKSGRTTRRLCPMSQATAVLGSQLSAGRDTCLTLDKAREYGGGGSPEAWGGVLQRLERLWLSPGNPGLRLGLPEQAAQPKLTA